MIYFRNVQSPDESSGQLDFSFALNGTSNPTVISGRGVSSVTRTGVGAFLVTLLQPYAVVRGVGATVNLGTTAVGDYTVMISGGTFPGPTTTFTVNTLLAGVAADVAAGTNFTIAVRVPFCTYSSDQVHN